MMSTYYFSQMCKEGEESDPKFLYRAVDRLSEWKHEPQVIRYRIQKETECGCWIVFRENPSGKKFVCFKFQNGHETKKRFAERTIEDAKQAYLFRKLRQHRIIASRLVTCERRIFASGGTVPVIQRGLFL